MALDTSFLDEVEPSSPRPEQSPSTLNVDFLDEGPANAEKLPKGFFEKIKDAVTGESRQTEATQGLPEFDIPLIDKDAGIGENIKRQGRLFSTALGLMTSFSPERQAKTLQNNFPDLVFEEDEKGNIIVDGSAYGGGRGVMNLPGLSKRDLMQVGFQVAVFTPAGAVPKAGAGVLGNALRVGAASGATQAAQDLASQATTGDVSIGDIDKSDVALVAGGGALFQGLFQGLGKSIPILRQKFKRGGITNEIRAEFRLAASKAGLNPDEVTDDVIDGFMRASVDATTPDETAAIAGEREFGIALTKGQRSGDLKQLGLEDSLRSGRLGEKAETIFARAEQEKGRQTLSAAQRLKARLGGEAIEGQSQAGAILKQNIRQAEEVASEAVNEAFDQVGDAALSVEGMKGLLSSSRKAIQGVEFDRTLPETAKVLSGIKKTERAIKSFEGKGLRPFHIQRLEQMRRRINTGIGQADGSDKRQLTILKRQWDNYMDDAVKNALFEGDQASLDALKSSRSTFSEYAKKFRVQKKKTKSGRAIPDKPGQLIENIIESDPTDIQVVNTIFGAGDSFGNTAGANFARRVKQTADEESWNAVRQAAFMRLVKFTNDGKTVSGKNTRNAITTAMKKNPELMAELFTPDEIGTLKRFAAHLVRSQPDKINPSGTSEGVFKTLRQLLPKLSFLTGDPILTVTGSGVQATSGFRSAAKARAATGPFSNTGLPKGGLVSGSLGSTASSLTALDE